MKPPDHRGWEQPLPCSRCGPAGMPPRLCSTGKKLKAERSHPNTRPHPCCSSDLGVSRPRAVLEEALTATLREGAPKEKPFPAPAQALGLSSGCPAQPDPPPFPGLWTGRGSAPTWLVSVNAVSPGQQGTEIELPLF